MTQTLHYTQLKTRLATNPHTWLITGVAGFIGSNLLEPPPSDPITIEIIDIRPHFPFMVDRDGWGR